MLRPAPRRLVPSLFVLIATAGCGSPQVQPEPRPEPVERPEPRPEPPPIEGLPPHALARFGVPSVLSFPETPRAIAYSADGKTLAVGGYDRPGIHLYDVASRMRREVVGDDIKIFDLAYAPGRSDRLAVCTKGLTVYELAAGSVGARPSRRVERPADEEGCELTWGRDGTHIMTVDAKAVAVYDVEAMRLVAEAPILLPSDTRHTGKLLPGGGHVMKWDSPPPLIGASTAEGLVAMSSETVLLFDGKALVRKPSVPAVIDGRQLVAMSHDGTRLLVKSLGADADSEIVTLGDPAGRAAIEHSAQGNLREYFGSFFSPDGATLLLVDQGSRDAGRLVDTRTGATLAEIPRLPSQSLAWRPDGEQIAMRDEYSIVFFDKKGARSDVAGSTSSEGRIIAVAFDAAASRVLTLAPHALRIWDRARRETLVRIPGDELTDMAIDLDANLGALIETDPEHGYTRTRRLVLVDPAAGKRRAVVELGKLEDVHIALSGDRVVVVDEKEARVYDALTGALVAARAGKPGMPIARRDAGGHSQIVTSEPSGWALTPIGADVRPVPVVASIGNLVAASRDGEVFVGRTGGEEPVLAMRRHGDDIYRFAAHRFPYQAKGVATSDDGGRIAAVSWYGVRVYDMVTGAHLGTRAEVSSEDLTSLALSRDGSLLLTGNVDGTTTLWELSDLAKAPAPSTFRPDQLASYERELFVDGMDVSFTLNGRADQKYSYGRHGPGALLTVKNEPLRCSLSDPGLQGSVLVSDLYCQGPFDQLFSGDFKADATGTYFTERFANEDHSKVHGDGYARYAYRTFTPGKREVQGVSEEVIVDARGARTCVEQRSKPGGLVRRCFSARGLESVELQRGSEIDLKATRQWPPAHVTPL